MIKPSRRDLILKMGAWPLLWPVLRSGRSYGAAVAPRRVLTIFSPDGPCLEQKAPAFGPSETDFQMNEWWAPLARHRDVGFFFSGMVQAGWQFGKNNEYGHQSAGTGALTARATEGTNNGTGPSIDQFIGQELQRRGVVTPKRSLLWGLHTKVGNWGPWFEAAGKPAQVQNDPYRALADIGGGLAGGGGAMPGGPSANGRLVRRKLALDAAYKECRDLAVNLGSEGKELLDFHCTNVASLQKGVLKSLENLAQAPAAGAQNSCAPPARPNTQLAANANFSSAESRDEMTKAFADLIAFAFACDVTRSIGFSFGPTADRLAIPSKYAVPSSAKVDSGDSGPQHHAWTHVKESSPEKRQALKTFYLWYSEAVALFLDKLKATPDANGRPLMDTTLVLWTSELGAAGPEAHPQHHVPVLLFGNSAGAFKPNRLFNGEKLQQSALILHSLFVSMAQHAGLADVNVFGNAGMGPLDWLKG